MFHLVDHKINVRYLIFQVEEVTHLCFRRRLYQTRETLLKEKKKRKFLEQYKVNRKAVQIARNTL